MEKIESLILEINTVVNTLSNEMGSWSFLDWCSVISAVGASIAAIRFVYKRVEPIVSKFTFKMILKGIYINVRNAHKISQTLFTDLIAIESFLRTPSLFLAFSLKRISIVLFCILSITLIFIFSAEQLVLLTSIPFAILAFLNIVALYIVSNRIYDVKKYSERVIKTVNANLARFAKFFPDESQEIEGDFRNVCRQLQEHAERIEKDLTPLHKAFREHQSKLSKS